MTKPARQSITQSPGQLRRLGISAEARIRIQDFLDDWKAPGHSDPNYRKAVRDAMAELNAALGGEGVGENGDYTWVNRPGKPLTIVYEDGEEAFCVRAVPRNLLDMAMIQAVRERRSECEECGHVTTRAGGAVFVDRAAGEESPARFRLYQIDGGFALADVAKDKEISRQPTLVAILADLAAAEARARVEIACHDWEVAQKTKAEKSEFARFLSSLLPPEAPPAAAT